MASDPPRSPSPTSLMSPDLEQVAETAETLLLTDALAASHLWGPDETPDLVTEVVRELCAERVRAVRQFAEEFSLLSGAGAGWRRGEDGDSCNSATLVSLGNFLWCQLLDLLPHTQDRLPQPVVAHHKFDTKLWFYVRSPPPDLPTQRSLIDPDSPGDGGSYLISCKWYNKLIVAKRGSGGGRAKSSKLGPIDNSCLMERDWKLRRSLLHSLTAVNVGEREWACLISWYGLAKGSMVVYGDELHGLGLYPLTIRSCVHRSPPSLYRMVSVGGSQALSALVDKVKHQYGVARERESRLFVYFDRSSFYRVEDLTELASIRLFHGQIVQLQLRQEDGTWEERTDVIARDLIFT